MTVGQAVIAPNKIYRTARAIGLIALAGTAVVGLLHTKAGKPLLAKMGGCPAGFATRDDMDHVRKYAATLTPPTGGQAPARPALGFVLDATTEDEFAAWTKKNKLNCEDNSRLGQVTCTGVPSPVVGEPDASPIDDLTVEFNPAHKIVNILILRHGLVSSGAVSMFDARVAQLEKELGRAPNRLVPTGPAYFDEAPMTSAVVEFKYKDYQCEISATTMMDKTVTMREHYYSTL